MICIRGRSRHFGAVLFQWRCLSDRPINPSIPQSKIAIKDVNGEHSFEKLGSLSTVISHYIRSSSSRGSRIGLLLPPSLQYIAAMIGVMCANRIAVPINPNGTPDEIEYALANSETSLVLTSRETEHILTEEMPSICISGDEGAGVVCNQSMDDMIGGLMVYTSGTTGQPKGVLVGTLTFWQWIRAIVHGWEINNTDEILHTLPLYHVHGILGLVAIVAAGGTVDMRQKFIAEEVWQKFTSPNPPSLYFGVPTQYSKLIEYYEEHLGGEDVKESMARIRLMVSGSAVLRAPVWHRWREITGKSLLERYGMTEVGLVLSNPLTPESDRRPGCVGLPFDGVTVRIVSEEGKVVAEAADGRLADIDVPSTVGELQIAGPTVFKEYFGQPKESVESFTKDGWFMTGDTAEITDGVFRILGRTSIDIIKSGGYKLSALEIERDLLAHPDIAEVAVIGLEDEVWGERVVAVVESSLSQGEFDVLDLKSWCKEVMSPYKIPKQFIVSPLPRNHMGKVDKKQIIKQIEDKEIG